jgi:hypothetical protein
MVTIVLNCDLADSPFDYRYLNGPFNDILFWKVHIHYQVALGSAVLNDLDLHLVQGSFRQRLAQATLEHTLKVGTAKKLRSFDDHTAHAGKTSAINFLITWENDNTSNVFSTRL